MVQSLNGVWRLTGLDDSGKLDIQASVPGSFYAALLKEGMMDDPYYGMNEQKSMELSRQSTVWEKSFTPESGILEARNVLLKFYGIDTISKVYLNGSLLGTTDNMHRTYVYDVTSVISDGENTLRIEIYSPLKYIAEKQEKDPMWGVSSTVAGYPHIRKAHYMYGWDWGPKLPDMGIWRDVELVGVSEGLLDGVYVTQDHSALSDGKVTVTINAGLAYVGEEGIRLEAELTSPNGETMGSATNIHSGETSAELSIDVKNPALWYPNGYGEHPLYSLKLKLTRLDGGELLDEYTSNVGLRTLSLCRDKMGEGEDFAFVVNGIKIFAMGANYIPEDQIIPRCSDERSRKLLESCADANFNMIRVWGGGYYPSDGFYSICDELGLLVWQDFMFACSVYRATDEFMSTVRQEIVDNVMRLRNHPSLALWCGNNEIESMWEGWNTGADPALKEDYLMLFEDMIPEVLAQFDPKTPYWPSSPSSCQHFKNTGDLTCGDAHYWAVWHSFRPFTDYFRYKFRFCSEYGFESLPSVKTVRAFNDEAEPKLSDDVMEAHQKCEGGTKKVEYYLAQMSHQPKDFAGLVYATQAVQSDAIRLNVEHMRQNRDVCRGSLYWQVNDSNPVISWASIDYFNRPKPLHYAAKRFYNQVLVSCNYENPQELWLNVSSERSDELECEISWRSRLSSGEIISGGEQKVTVKPYSSLNAVRITPEISGIGEELKNKAYLEFELSENGRIISSGTYMYVQPKDFIFADPKLEYSVSETEDSFVVEITAKAFAKGVFLELCKDDCLFTENYFDISGTVAKPAKVTVSAAKSRLSKLLSLDEFAGQLTVKSYYEALKL